jgi:hypothetical protein
MIRQLAPPTLFVIFTFVERLWDLLDKIKDLQFVHITKLIQINPITCARYYNHRTPYLCKLIAKNHFLFGYILILFFIIEFQNHGSENDNGYSTSNI